MQSDNRFESAAYTTAREYFEAIFNAAARRERRIQQPAAAMRRCSSTVFVPWLASILLSVGGCTPDVGSEAWCEALEDKPAGDWTANEAADYARHCLFD